MSTPTVEKRLRSDGSVVISALRRFVGILVVVLLLVGVASAVVARSVSREIAVRDAIARGTSFARGVSAPLVDRGVLQGVPSSLAEFGQVMDNRLRDGSIRHIKIWERSGRIIWSDEEALMGRRFELEPNVERLFRAGGAVGTISAPDRGENLAERNEGAMLEVYASADSAAGIPVIVESYWSTERIDDDATQVMKAVAPLTLGTLTIFALLVLPLAWSLARRVERTRDHNAALLRRSLVASDMERMRIARDLHDGVMQDVSGAGYALSAAVGSMGEDPQRSRGLVEDVCGLLQRVSESLRSTLVDIYPADLAQRGLTAAVDDLADRLRRGGVVVRTDVSELEGESLEVAQLCYRVIQEALRNVERHARATHAAVSATKFDGTARLVVEDDGVGLGEGPPGERHMGLRLLADTLRDVGGTLDLRPGREGGTVLVGTFPLHLGQLR